MASPVSRVLGAAAVAVMRHPRNVPSPRRVAIIVTVIAIGHYGRIWRLAALVAGVGQVSSSPR